MVAGVKKSGDLRICIDPQRLNTALQRELHPLPVIDDILPELSKARVFSRFDLRHGYWHCELDDESSYLTTFQTPNGRYRWRRLPFGLAVSSEIFQKRLHAALEGLDGVTCIADDILVYGIGDDDEQALKDHDQKLRCLLQRCRERHIRLNKEKIELRKPEITFLGHKITKGGLKADPEKIESIVKMAPPQNVTEVQRLSGMVNYLARFMPGLSDAMEPIRRLTSKDVEWQWTEEQEQAFEKVKQLVTSSPVLLYYDQSKALTIQCDASKTGLGSVLLQDGRPIEYASRALTPTEVRYAQIEKEMLAIVFSLTKFHQYTYGRQTLVITDHKPLQSIIRKPLDQAPKRLQGMILRVQKYDITLQFSPGKYMHIADMLSRAHLSDNEGGEEFESVNMVSYLPIREERLDRIREATRNDETLSDLIQTVMAGWPDRKSDLPPQLVHYYHTRDEMTIQDGFVFKGDRIIIPYSMRAEIKAAIHSSHIGIDGCLRRARECVYWPGMNAEIKEYISTCETCAAHQSSQQKETLMTHEVTGRPWEKIGTDLMEIRGHSYLVTVDYFSNFWEVDHLENTRSATVIRKLKSHFARYGIPSVLISDNGPQYSGSEFQLFAEQWDFEHRTSSPGHPQANGMAESAVKTAKRLITKAVESGHDPQLAILDYRNTPSSGADSSPAQRMLGRRTRTLLPMKACLLEPQRVDIKHEQRTKRLKNSKSAWYHDKGAKDLDPLMEGDVVRIKPMVLGKKTWNKGTIMERLDERSYDVMTSTGTLRRNRVHLKRTNEPEQCDDELGEMCPTVPDEVSPVVTQSDNAVKTPSKQSDTINNSSNETVWGTPVGVGQEVPRNARKARNQLPIKYKDFDMT